MKIIDAHMHFSNIESFKRTAAELSKLDYSYEGLQKEYREANVVLGIGMGLTEMEKDGFPDPSSPTPMGMDLAELPPFLVYCAGINPYNHLKQALTFTDDYSKFIFGTDWPLAPIGPYIENQTISYHLVIKK